MQTYVRFSDIHSSTLFQKSQLPFDLFLLRDLGIPAGQEYAAA